MKMDHFLYIGLIPIVYMYRPYTINYVTTEIRCHGNL